MLISRQNQLRDTMLDRMAVVFPSLQTEVSDILTLSADGTVSASPVDDAAFTKRFVDAIARAACTPDPSGERSTFTSALDTLAFCFAMQKPAFAADFRKEFLTRFCIELPIVRQLLAECEPAGSA